MAAIRVGRFGHLYIDFWYRGKRKRLSTGLKDTLINRRKVALKAKAIEHDIKISRKLDIHKYFPKVMDQREATGRQTLAQFFEFYVAEKTIRQTSMASLMSCWERHIEPYFGQWPLVEITKHEVLVFRNWLLEEKKLANSSVNLFMTQLAGILIRAHQEGLIPTYPMKSIGQLDVEKNKIAPFSFEELKAVLTCAKEKMPELHDMLLIWSRLGFRKGEILALKWANLDYLNATIDVRATINSLGGENLPKTKQSIRTLHLTPEVLAAFRSQEKRSRMLSEYIFPDPATGKRYANAKAFQKMFTRLLVLARVKHRGPNQMRHTFATLHIAAGENITWVSSMLGHRSVATTMEHYNKHIPNLTRNDGSAFERAFKEH